MRSIEGVVDSLVENAEAASLDERLFGPDLEPPYHALHHTTRWPLRPLVDAAFLLEDEEYARRVLEGIEIMCSRSLSPTG